MVEDRNEQRLQWAIRFGKVEDLPKIEPLWNALYKHQKDHGMFLEVSANSFKDWSASMKAALGRFWCLFIVELNGDAIGFLGGQIRTLPPYFGGSPFGLVSEVFVIPEHRSKSIGRALLVSATNWFHEQRVQRIELQVLVNNSDARRLYRDLGWKEELVQMVWELPSK